MENMRAKMVALLLMMVFVSVHGDCYDDCMKRCIGPDVVCSFDCVNRCSRPPHNPKAEIPPSRHVLHRGGLDLEDGKQ